MFKWLSYAKQIDLSTSSNLKGIVYSLLEFFFKLAS